MLDVVETRRWVNYTAELMTRLGVGIRDTWKDGMTVDDSGGDPTWAPMQPDISIKPDAPYAGFKAGKKFLPSGYQSLAYLQPSLYLLPHQWPAKRHVLVHELCHYLQHATQQDVDEYRAMDPMILMDPLTSAATLMRHVTQRVENEAYFIQAAYMLDKEYERIAPMISQSGYSPSMTKDFVERGYNRERSMRVVDVFSEAGIF